jgi:hypothetical protein
MRYTAVLLSLAVLCNGSNALARNSREALNQFAGIPRSAVTKTEQAEWKRSPDDKITCVDQNLRPRGSTISALRERPSDGRVAPERASCQNQIAQMLLSRLTSAQLIRTALMD